MTPTRTRLVLLPLVALIVVSGCGQGPAGGEGAVPAAREALEQGRLRTATIQLKNRLQQAPDDVEARWLLASLYLRAGMGAEAEKELRQAMRLGRSGPGVEAALLRARLLQRRYDQVAARLAELGGRVQKEPALALVAADLDLARGRLEAAEEGYERLARDPAAGPQARLGLVRVALARNDLEAAGQRLQALAGAVRNVPAAADQYWLLRGDLAFRQGDYDAAREAYGQVVAAYPERMLTADLWKAELGIVRSLLAAGDNDAAAARIEALRQQRIQHPLLDYLSAIVAYRRRDFDEAEVRLRVVEKKMPDFMPGVLLLGATQYYRGNLEQAERYVSRFVYRNPDNVPARKLLAMIDLRLGEPEQALSALSAVLDEDLTDAELLKLVGLAALKAGDEEMAASYARRAGAGDEEEARQLLARTEAALIRDASPLAAEVRRILALLRAGRSREATEAARALVAKEPEDARAHNALAVVLHLRGDVDQALAGFQRALELDPRLTAAALNAAAIQYRLGRYSEAARYYSRAREAAPNDPRPLIGLARVAEARGRQDRAVALLEEARRLAPADLESRYVLARFYARKGERSRALELAAELMQHHGERPRVLALYGSLLLAAGRAGEAVPVLERLAAARPRDAAAHYRLGQAYLAADRAAEAAKAFRQTLELEPDFLPAVASLTLLEARSGDFADAMARIQSLKREHPDGAAGLVLEGDVLALQGRYQAAAAAYRAARSRRGSTALTLKLYYTQLRDGDREGARLTLEEWLRGHPGDERVRLRLASLLHEQGEDDAAIAHYRKVLEGRPDQLVALNNLANILADRGQMDEALDLARQAWERAPDRPRVADTWGWILARGGRPAEAVPVLQQALAAAPGEAEVGYHLAWALARAGERAAAIAILERLLSTGREGDFPSRSAAENLLQTLRETG